MPLALLRRSASAGIDPEGEGTDADGIDHVSENDSSEGGSKVDVGAVDSEFAHIKEEAVYPLR